MLMRKVGSSVGNSPTNTSFWWACACFSATALASHTAVLGLPVFFAAGIFLPSATATAQNLHYDTSALSGLNPGVATWDLVTPAWQVSATPGTAAPGLWTNGQVAVFNTTAGTNTLTISGSISAAGLTNGGNTVVTSIDGGALGLTGNITFNGTSSTLTIGTGTAVTFAADQLLTNNLTSAVTINGAIAEVGGGRSLTKAGTGTLTLSGNNTYTGGTTLTAGTLILNSANAVGSTGAIRFGNGATGTLRYTAVNSADNSSRFSTLASQIFRLDTNSQSVTLSTALVSDGGSLAKSGAGTLTLAAASSLSGGYSISAGTLNLGDFTHATSGTVALSTGTVANGTFESSGSYTSTGDSPRVSATLNGTAGLTRNGANALQLTASNGYSGGSTLTSGEVRISTTTSLGTGNVSFNGGVVGLGANMGTVANTMSATGSNSYQFNTNSFTGTVSAALAGATNGLTKTNAGGIILTSEASSYGGVTSVLRGALTVSLLADGGLSSSIGSSPSSAANLIIGAAGTQGQAFLRYAGAGNASTDRLFTISNSTGSSASIENTGVGTLSFTNTGSVAFTGTALTPRTLLLGGANAGDNVFAPQIGDSDAPTSFSKQAVGKWIIVNPANNFTGRAELAGGILSVSTLADGGVASNIGASSNAATNLVLGTATTLLYTGAGGTTDRLFTLNSTTVDAAFTLNASGTGALNFTNSGAVAYSGTASQTRTLNLRGTNIGNNSLSAVIGNNGTAAVSITKLDAGSWQLSGLNIHSGVTRVSGGTLAVGNIANGGSASALGVSTNAPANLLLSNGTTLRYTGAVASTDRRFTLNGSGAGDGVTIEASGSGAVSFTNPVGPAWGTTNQTRILTLGGTNSGTNTFAGLIANNGTGVVSVTKADAGRWVLSGPNTYTGITTIAAGTLSIAAADVISNTSNLVLGGGTFDTGGFNETLGTLSLTDTSSIDFGSGGSILSFSGIGTSFDTTKSLSLFNWSGLDTGLGSDRLFVSNADVFSLAQLAAINFINPTNYAPGTYGAAQLASGEVVAVVPEPSSLVAIGLISLAILIRRQRWR